MGKEFWLGCRHHGEWQDDCIPCSMNKDIYENYEMYQALADVEDEDVDEFIK